MAEASISGIEFTITADTEAAVSSLNTLSNALSRLQKLSTQDLGLKSLTAELKGFVGELAKIKNVDKLEALGNALKGISSFGKAMGKLAENPDAINTLADALERISVIDFTNLATAASSISEIMAAVSGA